jgi:type IV pilus assembly protein PilB
MQITAIRQLIDDNFSLAWCRENVVIPMDVMDGAPFGKPGQQTMVIAVGNITFLGTIGGFIKQRVARTGLECQFVEKAPDEIQALLDQAAAQRIISGEGLETFEFSDDAILEALKSAGGDNDSGFDFNFDDSEEAVIESDILDLSAEMLGNKIQQAAAQILISSCRNGISDIHIEPRNDEYQIRLRRDGVLQPYVVMPRSAGIKLTACLKNMASMDVAERRASQDGKIMRRFEGQTMEFRCSTAPGKHGEKMVLRILNSNSEMLNLDILINNEQVREEFRAIIEEPNGIVIVAGPTGSGKSTTLAAALRERDNGEINIVTAEDPIEYDLGGNIQQFPVLRAKGQTFANLLRSFLRQDPDVILIGETRDPETAESSMDAAETGHLVFTTLHANSASSSLTRLLDMEVPLYKLKGSLRGILAQRLMRKVCPSCSTERPINEAEARFTGLKLGTAVRQATALTAEEKAQRKQEATLCPRCSGTGYQGRIGSYELLRFNRNIRDALQDNKTSQHIEDLAVSDGMLTLKAYAVELIRKQLTTVSELQKISTKEH